MNSTLTIFHQAANQGRAINMLRNKYREAGISITAHRAEIMIQLKILKQYFNNSKK